ncbi:hypothetical protein EVAR_101398_1 [Eumeta japonica]|uniref:Uncharacterized protein n=1 Tax=Eumeta variegata TaxID=151549 RepID=A0A4C1TFP7_EUMVA|nr:hypothetical protein EVAR_101398_1 [Eumeta japonica]
MTSDISHREKLAARDVPILRRDVYTQRGTIGARTMGIKSKAGQPATIFRPGLQFISIARGRRRPAVQVDTRDDSHDLNVLRLIDVADSRSGCCCRLLFERTTLYTLLASTREPNVKQNRELKMRYHFSMETKPWKFTDDTLTSAVAAARRTAADISLHSERDGI